MDRENMSAKNQSYTANTLLAKTPEFFKTAAMITTGKAKFFSFFCSDSCRLHLGQSKDAHLTVLIQCLKVCKPEYFRFFQPRYFV